MGLSAASAAGTKLERVARGASGRDVGANASWAACAGDQPSTGLLLSARGCADGPVGAFRAQAELLRVQGNGHVLDVGVEFGGARGCAGRGLELRGAVGPLCRIAWLPGLLRQPGGCVLGG